MTKIYYDMMPDYTVSVYLDGEWDFFKSWSNLCVYCDREFGEYDLVNITDTTCQERIELGLLDE